MSRADAIAREVTIRLIKTEIRKREVSLQGWLDRGDPDGWQPEIEAVIEALTALLNTLEAQD